jgi:hypothetical protein
MTTGKGDKKLKSAVPSLPSKDVLVPMAPQERENAQAPTGAMEKKPNVNPYGTIRARPTLQIPFSEKDGFMIQDFPCNSTATVVFHDSQILSWDIEKAEKYVEAKEKKKIKVTPEMLKSALSGDELTRVADADELQELISTCPDPKEFSEQIIANHALVTIEEVKKYVNDGRRMEEREGKERSSASITSPVAAKRMGEFIVAHGLGQTEFANRVGTTDRTIRAFQKTGKVRRDIFDSIAAQMSTTREELLKP